MDENIFQEKFLFNKVGSDKDKSFMPYITPKINIS